MIQVYLASDKLAKCRAIKVYSDGRTGPVDFRYAADGTTLDPAVCHSSIVKRFAAGEAIEEHPYPNEYFPAPPTAEDIAKQEALQRVEKYRELAVLKLAKNTALTAEDWAADVEIDKRIAELSKP